VPRKARDLNNPYESRQNEFFSGLFKRHGDNYKSLHWGSTQTQILRFVELLRITSYFQVKPPVSILDFGCGLGHLYKYFKDNEYLRDRQIEYTGVDINEDFISQDKIKYPAADFRVKTDEIYKEKFAFVFCSGVFNLKFDPDFDIVKYYTAELAKLFSIAEKGVAVNFQSIDGIGFIPETCKESELKKFYFHDPDEVMKNLKSITGKIEISKNYLPNDFTVYLLKQ
jgi:SAM-dependent methyltransferase